jgi:DNA-binding transcriptional ArsR family regulator
MRGGAGVTSGNAEPRRHLGSSPDAVLASEHLIRALGHPIRREILRCLHAAGEARSPRELALTLGHDLQNLSYHIRVLKAVDAVALTDVFPKAGSMEHFYVSTVEENGGLRLVLAATARHDEGS